MIYIPWNEPNFFPWREADTDSHSFSAISDATFLDIRCCLNWNSTGSKSEASNA